MVEALRISLRHAFGSVTILNPLLLPHLASPPASFTHPSSAHRANLTPGTRSGGEQALLEGGVGQWAGECAGGGWTRDGGVLG